MASHHSITQLLRLRDGRCANLAMRYHMLRAMEDIQHGAMGSIPRHLQNVHAGSAGAEKPQAYRYPHNYPHHYVEQRYLPEELGEKHYYEYGDNKTEQAAKRYWDEIKKG